MIGREQGADRRVIEVLDLTGEVVAGEVLLEAWRPPRPDRGSAEIELARVPSTTGAFAGVPMFEPEFVWDALPGGAIAYADSSTYTVRVVRDGAAIQTLTRPIAPQPVTRAIKSRMREEALRASGGAPAAGGAGIPGVDMAAMQRERRAAIENMTFYHEVPVIGRIRTTPDGFVWVRRQDPVNEDNDGLIDVFEPEGTYIGTLPRGGLGMSRAFGPGGLVAYWEIDEMDIPSVVVYRLPENLRR